MKKISSSEKLAFRSKKWINKNKNWVLSLLGGIIIGALSEVLANTSLAKASHLLQEFLQPTQLSTLIIWVASVIILLLLIADFSLNIYHRKNRVEVKFSQLLHDNIPKSLRDIARNHLAWGQALSLAICPKIFEGWAAQDIIVDHQNQAFHLPKDLKADYEKYYEENKKTKRLFDDGTKYMLTKNPIAFSDSPTLHLSIQSTKYSIVQFFHDTIAINTEKAKTHLTKTITENSDIDFPHSLSLHLIVTTKDNKILVVKRAPKVSYYPNMWSASIEDQLAVQDLQPSQEAPILHWIQRSLYEELGLTEDDYSTENLRILSCFVEADILNCALCGICKLSITSKELASFITSKPREDYELSEWKFQTLTEVAQDIKKQPDIFHPTTGYRIMMALIHKYGYQKALEILTQ